MGRDLFLLADPAALAVGRREKETTVTKDGGIKEIQKVCSLILQTRRLFCSAGFY